MNTIRNACVAVVSILLAAGQAYASPTPLIVAGGGGGSGANRASTGINGQSGTAGAAGSGGGAGGSMGSGGTVGTDSFGGGGGGAGVNGSGDGSSDKGGKSSPTYAGGRAGSTTGFYGGNGGFGGGGGGGTQGGGGGGGYSGGGGSDGANGGGGGSYVDDSLITLASFGYNTGVNGYITFSFLGALPSSQTFYYSGSVISGFTVSESGLYDITVAGAHGGAADGMSGGLGAILEGKGFFTAGTTFDLIVGGAGINGSGFDDDIGSGGGGGGGGSFVLETYAAPAPVMSAVPEPATWSMMILGVGATGATMRRKRKLTTRVSYAA